MKILLTFLFFICLSANANAQNMVLTGLNFSTIISYQPKRTNFVVIPSYGVGLYNQGFSLTFGVGHGVIGKAL